MIDQALNVAEFPFVERLPKVAKSRLQHVWDCFKELRQVVAVEGMLIQQTYASKLLGVSRQRVADLIAEGRLKAISVGGVRHVTESSLVCYMQSERKAGRPVKADRDAADRGVSWTAWSASKEYAKELVGVKKG